MAMKPILIPYLIMKKFTTWLSVILVLALAGFVYFKFYFPVASDAIKSGELNYVMYKGYIWKTYEGKLIQAGFRSKDGNTGVQSNEFDFSVVDEAVAQELMRYSGKIVSLRYKQYNGSLPWRGMQRNIVFAIDNVENRNGNAYQDGTEMNEVEAVSTLPYEE